MSVWGNDNKKDYVTDKTLVNKVLPLGGARVNQTYTLDSEFSNKMVIIAWPKINHGKTDFEFEF